MARTATAKKAAPEQTVGEIVKSIIARDEQISTLNSEVKKLKAEKDLDELALIKLMQAQGTDKVVALGKSITLETKYLPKIVDDLALWGFVKAHNAFNVYYRRLKLDDYAELMALNKGKALPGTEVTAEQTLSFRKQP